MSSLIQTAIQWANPNVLVQSVGQNLCETCGIKPKFVENGVQHPYCSRTCVPPRTKPNQAGSQFVSLQTPAATRAHATASNLCEICRARPKFIDTSTGTTHPYCSKGCAAAAERLCPECQARPKRVDGARKHDYCGQTCAQKAAAAHSTPRQNGVTPNPNGICQIPECSKQAHKNANGSTSRYCSLPHKGLAEKSCLYCRKVPKQGDQHFCGQACANEAMKKGPLILEVPEDHETFKSVKSQFTTSWRLASKPCPPVRYIYKIVSTHASMSKYNSYRDVVEARGQFKATGRVQGNENRRWHGTKRACRIGDKCHTNLCSSTSCSLCSIIRISFDVKRCPGGAFGTGIYTSSAVSKSNAHSNNTDAKAPLKAVLLNKVIVGRGYKMSQVNTTLKAPPAGFDSVLAEKGSQLDDDELVVYRNDAIRPSYLVMYDAQ